MNGLLFPGAFYKGRWTVHAVTSSQVPHAALFLIFNGSRKVNPKKVNPCPKSERFTPGKSEPLPDSCYETLAREVEMPRPQLSKASAVSFCKIQLDILTKLAEHLGRNFKPTCGGMAQSADHIVSFFKLPMWTMCWSCVASLPVQSRFHIPRWPLAGISWSKTTVFLRIHAYLPGAYIPDTYSFRFFWISSIKGAVINMQSASSQQQIILP